METTQKQRIKLFVDYLIQGGQIEKYADFGKVLGIDNKSRLSQLIGGTVNNESFINRLLIQYPQLSKDWLLTGTGEMINSTSGANSPVVNNAGDGNNFFARDKKDCEQILAAKDELISQLRGEVDYLRNLTTTLMSNK